MVMVRKNTLWLAMGLMMLCLASCNKDESGDPFTLSTKQYNGGAKTYINSGTNKEYACWKDGDKVLINRTEKTVSVSSGSGNTYEATVDGSDIAESENYISVYPASSSSISGSAITTTIPQTTTYTTISSGAGAGCQVIDAPMAAYSTTRGLTYENLCALTKFQFKAEGTTNAKLLSIRIATDKVICGTLTANYQNNSWSTSLNGTQNYRELSFGEGIDLSTTAKSFYLYVPEVSSITELTIYATVSYNGETHCFHRTKRGNNISLSKNVVYYFGELTVNTTNGTLIDDQSAYYIEPAGTENDPICIGSTAEWEDLMGLYAMTGKYFKLTNDISITNSIPSFNGTLDGNGKTITVSTALFKIIENATIKNLTTDGSITTTGSNIRVNDPSGPYYTFGVFAQIAQSCSLQDLTNNASISISNIAQNVEIGSIIGYMKSTSLNHCINNGTLTTSGNPSTINVVGGIVGDARSNSSIINCANEGALYSAFNTGGIAGKFESKYSIENCYVNANIQGGTYASGICHSNGNSNGKITNCYFRGQLTTSSNSSTTKVGVCYNNNGIISYCYYSNNIQYISREGSGSNSNCSTLSNATTITTITGDTPLAKTLNSNISTLHLTDALPWEVRNGIVTFVEQ